ncbi:hypothetical protein LCGC14_1849560, partial [marine sediment metagenome]
LKGSSGEGTYADFEPPYIPVVQNDWSGGRGQEDFERDRSRFFDSYRTNTWMANQVILGPQEQYTTGYRDLDQNMPGSVTWQALTNGQQLLAYQFAASASYTTTKGYLWVRRVGTPNGGIKVGVYDESGGEPSTERTSVTISAATFGADSASQWYEFDYANNGLTATTSYFFRVTAISGSDDADNHWEVAVNNASGNTQQSDTIAWSSASVDLYFRLVDADDDRESLFFEYKQGQYKVSKPTDGSAAQLWINGDRGAADANTGALTTTVDGSKSWTTDELINSVVILTGGLGSEEIIPWRVITSNTGTALTHATWNIEHDTTTEYVIVADDTWIEITGHGLTKPVTDVLVSKDIIYFAQADSTNIRKANFYNNSGTWTARYADDSTNKGTFLELVEDPVDGQQVWVADVGAGTVARGDAQSWGSDLSLGTGIVVGNTNVPITGLERYGKPEALWVLKEDSMWEVQNDIPDQIPLREMASVRSSKNGRAHLVHGVYFYFPLLHSLERYFRNNIDDVGPSQDFGLPANRQGPIVAMEGYPGIFFCAVDGGTSNYSSILITSGSRDWHELYRAPQTGQRIRNLFFQVIPGTTIDRLWFSQGTDVLWLPFPSDTLDPFRDSNYLFTHEGHLITSWMYADLQDVDKLFKSFKVFGEAYSSNAIFIECDYQTDGDTETSTWNNINGTFDAVPVEEIDLVADPVANAVTGRRVRARYRFYTNSNSSTPRMKATVAEMFGKIEQKYSFSCSFRAMDFDEDLQGRLSSDRVETLTNQLETWASSPQPLTFANWHSPFDAKTVSLISVELDPVDADPEAQEEELLGSLTLVEI